MLLVDAESKALAEGGQAEKHEDQTARQKGTPSHETASERKISRLVMNGNVNAAATRRCLSVPRLEIAREIGQIHRGLVDSAFPKFYSLK